MSAEPKFGTEVYLSDPDKAGVSVTMMGMDNGMMMSVKMTSAQ